MAKNDVWRGRDSTRQMEVDRVRGTSQLWACELGCSSPDLQTTSDELGRATYNVQRSRNYIPAQILQSRPNATETGVCVSLIDGLAVAVSSPDLAQSRPTSATRPSLLPSPCENRWDSQAR